MKRRSFLQGIGAAVAALFVPAVAARQAATPAHLTDPDAWHLIDYPSGGKTLWVDGSNVFPDGKDGTFERPYLTLQKAIDSCSHGDVIVVKSGHAEHTAVQLINGNTIIGLGPDRPRFIWPAQS